MNWGVRARQLGLPLTGLLLTEVQLAGQSVSARPVVAALKSSVRLGEITDREQGWWAGLALELHVGRFVVSGSGTRGRLTPSQGGTTPDQDVGELAFDGQYHVRPGLGLELRYAARAFSSAAGRQRWDILGVGATATRELGTPDVRATARLAYLPFVRVSDEGESSFAFDSEVGIAVAPSRSPLVFMLSYQIQRFEFPAASERSEQFEALTLAVGFRTRLRGKPS